MPAGEGDPPGPPGIAATPFAAYAAARYGRLPTDDSPFVRQNRRASASMADDSASRAPDARERVFSEPPPHSVVVDVQLASGRPLSGTDARVARASRDISPVDAASIRASLDEGRRSSVGSHPPAAPSAGQGVPTGAKRSKEALAAFLGEAGRRRSPKGSIEMAGRATSVRARASLEAAFTRRSVRSHSVSAEASRQTSGELARPTIPALVDAITATSRDISDLNDIRRSFGGTPPRASSLRVPSGQMVPGGSTARRSVPDDELTALRTFSGGRSSMDGSRIGSTRAQSDLVQRLRRVSGGQMGLRATSYSPQRYAFGTGFGWATIGPADEDAADAVLRNLAIHAEGSEARTSWVPLLKMTPTIVGKMVAAFGVDMFALGISQDRHLFTGLGAASMGVGILAVMVGMQALMYDMRRINPNRIPVTIAFSLVGMLLVSGALILSETDVGAQNLGARSAGAFLFGIGLTLLNTSLPLSFAYSEMVHGDTFRDYRNEAAFVLWGLGLGVATGLTVSRGAPNERKQPKVFPFGVAHAFAVFGIACATFGTCLVATNLQRQVGLLLGLRTRVRQLAAQARGDDDA